MGKETQQAAEPATTPRLSPLEQELYNLTSRIRSLEEFIAADQQKPDTRRYTAREFLYLFDKFGTTSAMPEGAQWTTGHYQLVAHFLSFIASM